MSEKNPILYHSTHNTKFKASPASRSKDAATHSGIIVISQFQSINSSSLAANEM